MYDAEVATLMLKARKAVDKARTTSDAEDRVFRLQLAREYREQAEALIEAAKPSGGSYKV